MTTPSSEMQDQLHQLFYIDEILLKIFDFLDKRPHQFRFMLLCRATCRVALAEMWRDLCDPWPLLDLIPSDVKLLNAEPDSLDDVLLSRALTPQEWECIARYTKSIRSITFSEYYAIGPGTPVSRLLCIFSTYRGSTSLFGDLQSVSLDLSTTASVTRTALLLSCGLERLSLSLPSPDDDEEDMWTDFDPLLATIVTYGARLVDLHIEMFSPVESIMPGVLAIMETKYAQFVHELRGIAPRLSNVRLGAVSTGQAIVPELATLSSLLEVSLAFNRTGGSKLIQFPSGSFANLKSISLDSMLESSQPDTIRLLNSIESHNIEKINLEYSPDLPVVAQIIQLVASKWSATLTEFRLQFCSVFGEGAYDYSTLVNSFEAVPFAYIQPLLSCKKLRTMMVSLSYPFSMTDRQVQAVVTALPRLRNLRLGAEMEWTENHYTPDASLRSLRIIASQLPHLQALSLDVDFKSEGNDDDAPAAGMGVTGANRSVLAFETNVTGGGHAKSVRKLLKSIFPALGHISIRTEHGIARNVSAGPARP